MKNNQNGRGRRNGRMQVKAHKNWCNQVGMMSGSSAHVKAVLKANRNRSGCPRLRKAGRVMSAAHRVWEKMGVHQMGGKN